MPKVSDEHREAVRSKLLKAAARCLARKGYEATTTRDIAAEAKVSAGTLYNYFPSKEALIEELAEDVLGADLVEVGAADVEPDRLVALLRNFVFGRPGGGTPVLAQLRGRVSPEANPPVGRFNAYVVDAFLPAVKAAQAAGRVRADLDTEAVIELIDIVWDGMTRRAAGGTFRTSYERVGAVAMALITEGALDDDD